MKNQMQSHWYNSFIQRLFDFPVVFCLHWRKVVVGVVVFAVFYFLLLTISFRPEEYRVTGGFTGHVNYNEVCPCEETSLLAPQHRFFVLNKCVLIIGYKCCLKWPFF